MWLAVGGEWQALYTVQCNRCAGSVIVKIKCKCGHGYNFFTAFIARICEHNATPKCLNPFMFAFGHSITPWRKTGASAKTAFALAFVRMPITCVPALAFCPRQRPYISIDSHSITEELFPRHLFHVAVLDVAVRKYGELAFRDMEMQDVSISDCDPV